MDIAKIMTDAEGQAMPHLLRYYIPGSPLMELLMTHSRNVARKALQCMAKHGLDLDAVEVARAALLHDIGIVECDAKGIYCFGKEPYIRHGVIGSAMLASYGLPAEALVCERHTGSGITAEEIEMAQMPLPVRDMVPASTLERLVCYADKFYSKSGDPNKEKEVKKIRASLSRFGSGSIERFDELHNDFG